MNLFWLETDSLGHLDPDASARSLDNCRINKMAVETAQILSTAVRLNSFVFPDEKFSLLYEPTHRNHPCVKWAAESSANFELTVRLGFALCREAHRRYDHHPSCLDVICVTAEALKDPHMRFTHDRLTLPPLAVATELKRTVADARELVEVYRDFFATKPRVLYDAADVPEWFRQRRKLPYKIRLRRGEPYAEV